MAIFYTDKAAKAEIAELNQRIESLEADNQSAADQIETLTTENKDLTAKAATLGVEKEEAETKVSELTKELAAANESVEAANKELATFDDKVEAAALAKFESLGGQPIPSSHKHDDKKEDISSLTGLAKTMAALKQKAPK